MPVRGAHLLAADGVGQEAGAVPAVRAQGRAEGADAAPAVLAEQLQRPPRVDGAHPRPRGRGPRLLLRHGGRGVGCEAGGWEARPGAGGRRPERGKRWLRVGRRDRIACRRGGELLPAADGLAAPLTLPRGRAAEAGRPASPPAGAGPHGGSGRLSADWAVGAGQ